MRITNNDAIFPPNKYVREFSEALSVFNDAEDETERNVALDELDCLYEIQCSKLDEEYAEQDDETISTVLAMTQTEAVSLMGELADLLQATVQKMYMVGLAHGISVPQIIAMTMLKCITRDKDFYGGKSFDF